MRNFITIIFFFFLISLSYSESFVEICKNKNNYSSGTQKTVNIILKNYNTKYCTNAYNKILKNKSLTLMNTIDNLYIISKLYFLTHITLLADSIPKNQLDIKYLSKLKNLKFVNLSYYDLLDFNQLNDLPELETLILLSSNLSRNDNTFSKNINFKVINLFYNLKNLKHLTFSGYNVIELDKTSFINLQNLRQLFLANNNLYDVNGIKDLKYLYQLDLTNNPLDYFFEEIKYQGDYLILKKTDIMSLQNLINKYYKF